MKCIIAGGREAPQWALTEALKQCPFTSEITEVVSGKARGADTWGEYWAKQNKIPVKAFPAEWDKYDKSAGYRRNGDMALYAKPNGALIALWDGESRGTKHMIDLATAAGLRVFIFRYDRAIHV
jgi:hypothetical protein